MGKSKVIFITEKWCDGRPEKGLTNNFHNLFGSLESSNLDIPYDNYFVDEIASEGSHITYKTKEIIDKEPELVVISFLGSSPLNPSTNMVKELHKSGIKICVMWPDTGYPWALEMIESLGDAVKLHVSYGGERIEHPYDKNHLWLWAPQDERLFRPSTSRRPISFVGSLHGYVDRSQYLRYAVEKGVLGPEDITGGQREKALSAEEYAHRIRSSGININFPESPSGKDQCKGRVIESIASMTMLLERKNEATPNLLKPGVEYVEFDTLDDFVDKIKYYKDNELKAFEVAVAGYKTYKDKYSSNKFWTKVLEGCSVEV